MKGKGTRGYIEFELDLIGTLKHQLPPVFDALKAEPLTEDAVNALPQHQGVYMLLENDNPMYIGKTDAKHGFHKRLERHFRALSSRDNIDLTKVTFKAVRVMVFTTVNVESILIDEYVKGKKAWQNSGFGSNDPGHRRETQEPSDFDIAHPINIDLPLGFVDPGKHTVLELLVHLKDKLPYYFRYETEKKKNGKYEKHTVGHVDQRKANVNVPNANMTLRDLLTEIVKQLPKGWIATVFPGRVILYKEPTTYPYQVTQIP